VRSGGVGVCFDDHPEYRIKLKTIVAHRYNPESDQKGFEELSDMKTGDSRRP